MSTLVSFALREEATPFRKIAAGKPGLSILITGIGRQNAEKSVREFLADNSPKRVLSCGFAGGLDPSLKIGDAVFLTIDQGLGKALVNAGAKPVNFFCADRIAGTAVEKKTLRDKTGAHAVEMESHWIHTICREQGIPYATVRVISDTANEDLPLDFNKLSKPDKSLDYGKLFWAIARSPGKAGALMKLQKQTRFAAERLAEVLTQIVFP